MSGKLDRNESTISNLDRKLSKILLSPNGDLKSSKNLSAKLEIPITTVRRRLKRLESKFSKMYYVLDIEKFGSKGADFFISIRGRMVNAVANKMLDFDKVTYIGKSIGEHTIDLRVETILKDKLQSLTSLKK